MSDVLIDSSAWVDFFRGDRAAVARVDPLLAGDRAAICGPITAEVVSGARTLAVFNELRARLRGINQLPDPSDIWDRVAEARFNLARQGIQAHLADLVIAVTANVHGHSLLTRDKDFVRIAKVVVLDVDIF